MPKHALWAASAVLALVAVSGCQTTKPASVAPQASAIQAEKAGFCPTSQGQSSLALDVSVANADALKSWKVEVIGGQTAVRTWSGDAANVPAVLSWDGKSDDGNMAAEGTYVARLSVEYAKTYQPTTVESGGFLLDLTAPTGVIALDPQTLDPTDKGVVTPMSLTIKASSTVAKMDRWELAIEDSSGTVEKTFQGQFAAPTATWDGSLKGGGFVQPFTNYTAFATVKDEFGNAAELKAVIPVAAVALSPEQNPMPETKSQTPPGMPASAGVASIVASASGFSPNGDAQSDTISFAISLGRPDAVRSWKVEIASASDVAYVAQGGKANLPKSLTWDGKTNAGATATEGTYTAALSVDYGEAFTPAAATSSAFVLDTTPPAGSISLSSPLFSPIEGSDTITLSVNAASPVAGITSWKMDIYDPGGNVFRSFSGNWPSDKVVWDGKGVNGDLVQSAEDYPVVATVRDQYGNTGTLKGVIPVDILVEKTATGYRILASRIFFKSFTADYHDVTSDLAAQNADRLDALAKKLSKFPGYSIKIVGHAVSIYWYDPARAKIEQKDVLIPLSTARAQAIKAALVRRGLDAARFTTDGVGSADQLVPDSNLKDRWQNRRVALFLEKS